MNNELTKSEREFVAVVAASLGTRQIDINTDEIGYSQLFVTATQQKLLPYVFEYVRLLPAAEKEENKPLFAMMKKNVINQVMGQTISSLEFSALYRTLIEKNLHPILVKGQLCSRLYPMKEHRISADNDIYVSDDEFLACHEALVEYGLTTECDVDKLMDEDEVTYMDKSRGLCIEMHRRLFDSSEDAYDELNPYFADAHKSPIMMNGVYSLTPHEHMLYLILHAYKHFVVCGIGLRQFVDIAFWGREYYSEIDWKRLYRECRDVHAQTFAQMVFKINEKYLGIETNYGDVWKNEKVPCEPLLHDVLCGGIYGSNDYTRLHSSTVTLSAVKSSRKGKGGGLRHTLFPKKSYMEKRYKYVEKNPILLPLAWANRIVDYLKETGNNDNDSATDSLKLAKERIELMKIYDII